MKPDDLLPPQTFEAEEELDPFLEATLELEESSRMLDLEDSILHRLRHTEREITLNLPLVREHAEACSVTSLRVQHFSAGAPTLGAVRFSPEANFSSLRAAAMGMTWQLSLLELPFGGAAGAVVCNPAELSERELKALAKDYVRGLRGMVGPFSDVLMPDAGCNQQTMAWMLDAQMGVAGRMELGAITGKPSAFWGIAGYHKAAADGIMALLHQASPQHAPSVVGQRAAVQGFGALGSSIARALYDAGARVIALADVSGGLYNPEGINIPEVGTHVSRKRVLFGYPHAEAVCNADVLEADCELLVLAAHERQIGATNAARIRAPLVLEATHAAVTHAANGILLSNGIRVVPDLLTTAGSTLAAFAEWKQNVGLGPRVEALTQFINDRIVAAYNAVKQASERHHVGLRRAAHLVALERVAAGIRLR